MSAPRAPHPYYNIALQHPTMSDSLSIQLRAFTHLRGKSLSMNTNELFQYNFCGSFPFSGGTTYSTHLPHTVLVYKAWSLQRPRVCLQAQHTQHTVVDSFIIFFTANQKPILHVA